MAAVHDPHKAGRDLCHRATVIELQDSANEVAKIAGAILRPLPSMPSDVRERELALLVQVCRERQRARRLLALLLA